MDNLVITVAIGSNYQKMLELNCKAYSNYAKKYDADFKVINTSCGVWWGREKFRVGQYVKQYNRTLYIDVDATLHPDLPNFFSIVPETHVGMHDDYPKLLEREATAWIFPSRFSLLASQRVNPNVSYTTVLNSGVVICSRNHSSIWKDFDYEIPKHHCDEQFWIEYNAQQFPIHILEHTYNWQAWFRRFDETTPMIKHYANYSIGQRLAYIKRDNDLYHAY